MGPQPMGPQHNMIASDGTQDNMIASDGTQHNMIASDASASLRRAHSLPSAAPANAQATAPAESCRHALQPPHGVRVWVTI
jgi:hypothetical protein